MRLLTILLVLAIITAPLTGEAQLAPVDVAHVTRVEGPDGSAGGQQLTLI